MSDNDVIREYKKQRMRDYRARVKDRGLIQLNVTIPAECRDQVKAYCAKLRKKHAL